MPINNYVELDLVSSAARTATGNSGELATDFRDLERLRLQLEVTAASGTSPTLDVVLQDSLDGTNWNTVGTFAQKTATGLEVINVLPEDSKMFSRRLRVLWTIGGTGPSFTFNVRAVGR